MDLPLEQRLPVLCPVYYSDRIRSLCQNVEMTSTGLKRQEELVLLEEANQVLTSLDDETLTVFNLLRDRYTKRFPEMDSLSLGPLEYGKVVLAINDIRDLTRVDYAKILPPTTVLAMAMPASTTIGRPLVEEELSNVKKLATIIIDMHEGKQKLLSFLESCMAKVAPNVTAIVGTKIASQLIGITGSVAALAKVPAGNIHVLGRTRKELAGFSLTHVNPHAGFIFATDLVTSTPPQYKTQAQRLISNKVALAARIDYQRQHTDGSYGKSLRQEIIGKLEKLVEPAKMNKAKVIPPPPIESSKKRGGRRARRQKEIYAQTQIRQMTNRMEFGKAEQEIIVGSSVRGMGELGTGSTGTGRLKAPTVDNKLSEKIKRESQKAYAGTFAALSRPLNASLPTAPTSGTATSLRITPDEGIQLDTAPAPSTADINRPSRYFGSNLSFKK